MKRDPEHRVSQLADLVLHPFTWEARLVPPYTVPVPEWLQQEAGYAHTRAPVLPARVKVGWAFSPSSLMMHSIRTGASFCDGKRVWFATRWKCYGGVVGGIFSPSPDATGARCARCATADLSGPGVYRLYDGAGLLLYLGSSMYPHLRILEHRSKAWWPDVARTEVTECGDVFSARAAETRALATEPSVYNRRRCT
jgi:hypothetical protein